MRFAVTVGATAMTTWAFLTAESPKEGDEGEGYCQFDEGEGALAVLSIVHYGNYNTSDFPASLSILPPTAAAPDRPRPREPLRRLPDSD
jgi:hypothetical protein